MTIQFPPLTPWPTVEDVNDHLGALSEAKCDLRTAQRKRRGIRQAWTDSASAIIGFAAIARPANRYNIDHWASLTPSYDRLRCPTASVDLAWHLARRVIGRLRVLAEHGMSSADYDSWRSALHELIDDHYHDDGTVPGACSICYAVHYDLPPDALDDPCHVCGANAVTSICADYYLAVETTSCCG